MYNLLIFVLAMYRYFPNNSLFIVIILFLSLIISSTIIFSQTSTNLEILYSLNDSLTTRIINDLPKGEENIRLELNLGDAYSIFANRIRTGFTDNGMKIFQSEINDTTLPEINLVMENAGVEYGEMDRNGWFSDYYTPRTIFISGNYFTTVSAKPLSEYYIAVTDTIRVEDINSLENESFPFTRGQIPTEPLFSSIWEPVIAIGIAAATVILFFSIRNK